MHNYTINAKGRAVIRDFIESHKNPRLALDEEHFHYCAEHEAMHFVTGGLPLIEIGKLATNDGKAHVMLLKREWFDLTIIV